MTIYDKTVSDASDIELTTYYKDPLGSGIPTLRLPTIVIHSRTGSTCTVTIGEDANTQDLTEAQALGYINSGGYSKTP